MKSIFIAVPVYQYAEPQCIESIFKLVLSNSNKFHFEVRFITGYSIDTARTKAVEEFIGNTCDYLLFIDGDIIADEFSFLRLIEDDKDIVSGVYNHKHIAAETSVIFKINDGKFEAFRKSEVPNDLFEITACGLGFCLIKRDLLLKVYNNTGKVPFRFMQKEPIDVSEDIYFCNEVARLEVPIYADGRAKVSHIGKFLY